MILSLTCTSSKREYPIQCTMSNTSAGHSNHQPSHISPCVSFSIPPLCSLIYQLIKRWIDVVRKLNLRDGLHPLSRTSNRKSYQPLFTQRRVKDPLRAKLCGEIHAAAKHSPKSDIFAENEDSLIRAESVCKSTIDSLEQILAGGRRGFR
jgi:hypothetical protein